MSEVLFREKGMTLIIINFPCCYPRFEITNNTAIRHDFMAHIVGFDLLWLTPPSTLFQLYHGDQF
jgi:hypothetical protein